ncbi:condensation domain-containing protein [Planotetraspora mira]|uniref:Carrier domain-containing protein n=1 Tax=Planotetraspora mira TaxID=58121 RepID=A0A8J3TVZ2_9ACTN|nr:condensation domain-containing protein [Planotetraspora mira]GII33227.1 hypothetical protein Pmi06nite_66690 [Planotetraspora mira]
MSADPRQASFAQVGMWLTERMGRAGSAYHMPLLITFDGPLDACALIQACETLVRRHPILATAIEEQDGIPVEVPAERPQVTVTATEDIGPLVRAETLRPFDVGKGPLVRFTLARVSSSRHVLLVVAHHLVFDGESKDVLVRDLAAFYNGRPLARLTMSYADHAAAERERVHAVLGEAGEYWRGRWREPAEIVLPVLPGASSASGEPDTSDTSDMPGLPGGSGVSGRRGSSSGPAGAVRSREATEGGVHTFRAALRDVPGVSRFEVFLASVHALLFAYGNAEPVCAVDMSTRTPEVRDHIGLFVNELPVWSAPAPGMTVAGLAGRLHDDLRLLYRFRQVPLARAVRGLRPRTALAPVSVSYRRRREEPEFAELDTSVDWAVFNHAVRSTLHLQAVDGPDGLDVIMQYSSRTLPDVTHIAKDLSSIMKNPDTVIEDIAAGRTEQEGLAEEIRAIWQEVLGIDEIGDEEDLFDLGGHSLTITQIIARMRKRLDVEVPLDVFFDTPTIAGVLESIAAGREPGLPDASGSRR